MTDEKETTTKTWQDRHSGQRGHQLMTEKLADTIPAIGATENAPDYDEVLAPAKLFSPYSNWSWYITEMDRQTGQCFGLVEGLDTELGYFDLTELAETTVLGGVPAVERDLYWQPMTLGEIKNGSRNGSPHSEETDGDETVNDEAGTENAPSDVVNVEEFLFGAAAGDAPADDNPGDADGEFLAADATADGEDAEISGEPDADTETADEPDTADADAGDEPAPAEPETSEELKVVLSIRGGRAVIGVQRPSADPHIEVFDGLELPDLAQEIPGVVERARARWEESPQHPAYEKPAPPARQRNRRQQAAAPDDAEAGEAEQPQAETLRLF